MPTLAATPELDVSLLHGFAFRCRPDCGLCCYTEPRVGIEERSGLRSASPPVPLRIEGRDAWLASRPDGGACAGLEGTRCRVHDARPLPCRRFPITVHLGERAQASLVLSCPGVDLGALLEETSFRDRPGPRGLEAELAAARRSLDRAGPRAQVAATRQRRSIVARLDRGGRWAPEAEVRSALGAHLPLPEDADFPAEDPPSAEEGLELLPMVFARRAGPVAIAQRIGGWEFLELRPEGGVAAHLGVVPPPFRRPPLAAAGTRLLEGYLRYVLARDDFLGYVLVSMEDGRAGSFLEEARLELRRVGALLLSRAVVLSKLDGAGGTPLEANEVARGIRATDQDILDRPSWGIRV